MSAAAGVPAGASAPPGAGGITPARLIMAVFFLHSLLIANWVPRIPDVATALGLDHRELALALIGMPVGTFISIAVSGRVVEWLGARRTILVCFTLYCLLLSGPGFATSGVTLFLALLAIGIVFSFIDVAMNVEAARIQDDLGHAIMSTAHGFWSVGSMVGALMSGQIAEFGVSPGIHLLVVGLAALPVVVAVTWRLPVLPPRAVESGRRPPVFALPTLGLLGLCVFATSAVLVEGLSRNWGGVFLRDVLTASPREIGIAIAGFSLAMAVGRFAGNWAINRFGPVAVARTGAIVSAVGLTVVVLSGNVIVASAGFVALGLGISVGFPLAVTAGARRTDRPAATNVAALALFVNAATMLGLALVGFVAEGAGLRVGVAIALPVIVASVLLAGELRGAEARDAPARSMS